MDQREAKAKYDEAGRRFRQGDYAGALELLDELDAVFPGNAQVLAARGWCQKSVQGGRAMANEPKSASPSILRKKPILFIGTVAIALVTVLSFAVTTFLPAARTEVNSNPVSVAEQAKTARPSAPPDDEMNVVRGTEVHVAGSLAQTGTIGSEIDQQHTLMPQAAVGEPIVLAQTFQGTYPNGERFIRAGSETLPQGEKWKSPWEKKNFKAEAEVMTHGIQLSWENYIGIDPGKTIVIYRRVKGDHLGNTAQISQQWPTSIAQLPRNSEYFLDKGVKEGIEYEYRLEAYGPFQRDYVVAGFNVPMQETRGAVLFLVDGEVVSNMRDEIDQTMLDMVGDGWNVLFEEISPSDSVEQVKHKILMTNDAHKLRAVYLLGNVPVPYSGPFDSSGPVTIDGHGNHVGALPADAFYFDLDGTWTDAQTTTSAADLRNQNRPGDGKYDQGKLPSETELEGGRVDLSDMPAFKFSEPELLRQYLTKAHRYKTGRVKIARRLFTQTEWFQDSWVTDISAYHQASVVGRENIHRYPHGSWDTLLAHDFLIAIGHSGAEYTSSGGIGSTDFYAREEPRAAFFFLLGSYFGDWDVPNNLLRAPLGMPNYGLATSYDMPIRFLDHMALGETIGYAQKLSINNVGFFSNYAGSSAYSSLHGDPTLRMEYPQTVSDVRAAKSSKVIEISWQSSPEEGILEQRIYRSQEEFSGFERIAIVDAAATSYTDEQPPNGKVYYMVRAVKLTVSPSGSYYNGSIGQFADVVN